MGSLPDSKYIIQTDGYYFVESHDVDPSKGYITVSAKGIVNGLSNIPNDGADFGPDSYSPTSTSAIPYTETSGIMEAIKFLPLTFYAGANGKTYSAPQGTIYMKNGVYKCTAQITLPEGSNIRFIGESPPQPITWFGGFALLSSPDQYTGGAIIYFPTSVAYPVFHAPANSGHPAEQLYFENVEIRIENPSSYQDATAVDLDGWNMGGCKHFYITSTGASVLSATPMGTGNIDTGCTINASSGGGTYREFDDFRVAGFYNNGLITSIPNANFQSISIACVQSVDSGTGALNVSSSELLTTFNYVHLFYCNVGIQYTQNSPYNNYYFNMIYFESDNTPLIATMTAGAAEYYLPIPINAVLLSNIDTSGNIVNQYTGDIADKLKVRILTNVQLLNQVSGDSPISPDWINNGTTSGTINGQIVEWTQNYKKIMMYFDSYENDTTTDQTLTFPNAFNVANAITANTTGLSVSATTSGITITAPDSTTKYSGIVIIEGY